MAFGEEGAGRELGAAVVDVHRVEIVALHLHRGGGRLHRAARADGVGVGVVLERRLGGRLVVERAGVVTGQARHRRLLPHDFGTDLLQEDRLVRHCAVQRWRKWVR